MQAHRNVTRAAEAPAEISNSLQMSSSAIDIAVMSLGSKTPPFLRKGVIAAMTQLHLHILSTLAERLAAVGSISHL